MSGLRYRRRKNASPVIIILSVVIGLALIFELAVPRIIESRLEDAVRSSVDRIESVRIHLRTFPAIGLISSGSVNSISIDCKGLFVEGLRIDSLMVNARDILIHMQALTGEGRLVLSRVGQGEAEVALSEDDLNRYIRRLEGVPESCQIELSPGQVTVRGYVNVAGIDIPVSIEGMFVAEEDGTRLSYVINHIRLGNATLPSIISDGLLRGLDFSLDMSDLPIPVVISHISIEDKTVRIIGRTLSDTGEGT